MTDHPLHILEWLNEIGDDVPLSDIPINRFDQSEVAAKAAEKQSPKQSASTRASIQDRVASLKNSAKTKPSTSQEAVLPDETVIAAAKELAETANSIAELKEAISGFDGCNLRRNAKNTVFCDGDATSDLLLIDEHPGREEDQTGIPFAGRSGALLEKMLAAIGLNIDEVYRVSALPWHPPGSRPPTPPELAICKPFLARHIALANPKFIVVMGNTPARMLFDNGAQPLSLRSKWHEQHLHGKSYKCLVTLNPKFLLKQPAQKRLAWQDILMIKSAIESAES